MSKVLIVVDMQNDFVTGSLGNERCQAIVPNVVERIMSEEYSAIIVTRDMHDEQYLSTQEGSFLPVEHCRRGTNGSNLVTEVYEAIEASRAVADIYEIDKSTFGSFTVAELLNEEIDFVPECIDFVGVCTGICVLSNVIITKTALPEVPVNVFANACACVTQDSHDTAIKSMKLLQVNIL